MSTRAGLLIVGLLILALAGAAMLGGCAASIPERMVCFEQLIAQTERPPLFVTRHYCVSEEQYAEMLAGKGI